MARAPERSYIANTHLLFNVSSVCPSVTSPSKNRLARETTSSALYRRKVSSCIACKCKPSLVPRPSLLPLASLVPSPTLGRWVWLPAYSKLGQHYVSGPRSGPVYARYRPPPEMGPPRPRIARDMGTGGPEISSDMGTGGPRNAGDMGIL